MRIAIIGAGISGNLCARLLSTTHRVELYDAGPRPGGHAHTVTVEAFGNSYDVDTGFMVFNDRTYPNFRRLLELLKVSAQPSDMSFSVRCDRTMLEYQGSSLNGLFAQRRNLVRPSFWRLLTDIVRFNRRATRFVTSGEATDGPQTLRQFISQLRLSKQMIDQYLVPMGAAIWSTKPDEFLDFPANFILNFFHNHGLLQIVDRPRWMTVQGRSRAYVDKLLAPIRDRVHTNCPIDSVRRHESGVTVALPSGVEQAFDAVVFATHADQTLKLLGDNASSVEREVLGSFPYQQNEAVLHTDRSVLPSHPRAWASWNYHIPATAGLPVTLTYDVNRLQRLGAPNPICVTLNPTSPVASDHVLERFQFAHPVFDVESATAQERRQEINGKNHSYFCGAYWGYGFHEDGVNSALAVTQMFEIDLSACKVASTQALLATPVDVR